MENSVYDVLVIGSGPGGYIAAIKAAKLGFRVGIIEKEDLGGICLNWGCIPTKSLLKSAQVISDVKNSEKFGVIINDYKIDFPKIIQRSRSIVYEMRKGIGSLLKKNNIELIQGKATFLANKTINVLLPDNSQQNYSAKRTIIATGARNRQLLTLNNNFTSGYKEVLSLKCIPKKIVIIGGGAIGIEFAYFYNSLGTKVILLEKTKRILPTFDADISDYLKKFFIQNGIEIYTEINVNHFEQISEDNYKITYTTADGKILFLDCDVILSAIGVIANIENLGLESINVELENGRIKVDDYYKTSVNNIYAIGDVINTPSLAHVASAEGCVCVEAFSGLNPEKIDYNNIPSCIYTNPEVASVGYTEEQAIEKNYEIRIGKFPLSASGKACAIGHKEGFVKVIFDKKYGEWLGAHIVGYNATELIAEVVVARSLETTGYEIMRSVHPHPTISEAIFEAVCDAYGECLNL